MLREHRGERTDDDAQEERGKDARVGRDGSNRSVPAGLEWRRHHSIVAHLGVCGPSCPAFALPGRWHAPVARESALRPGGYVWIE